MTMTMAMTTKRTLTAADNSAATLQACGVPLGADFHALDASQVDALLEAAGRARYRKPRTANGSRARYFHAMLQRIAARRKGE